MPLRYVPHSGQVRGGKKGFYIPQTAGLSGLIFFFFFSFFFSSSFLFLHFSMLVQWFWWFLFLLFVFSTNGARKLTTRLVRNGDKYPSVRTFFIQRELSCQAKYPPPLCQALAKAFLRPSLVRSPGEVADADNMMHLISQPVHDVSGRR